MTTRVFGLRPGIVVVALCWFGLPGGCATVTTGSYTQEGIDFRAFRSFSWISADAYVESDSPRRLDHSTRSLIETGIREQLQEKGYAFTPDRDAADILVAYTVGRRDRIRMDAYPVGYRGHWGWHEPYAHYFFRNVSVTNYTRGTLGVDVFDNETGKPVWHGWAQEAVPQNDHDKLEPTIAEGIVRLFAALPD